MWSADIVVVVVFGGGGVVVEIVVVFGLALIGGWSCSWLGAVRFLLKRPRLRRRSFFILFSCIRGDSGVAAGVGVGGAVVLLLLMLLLSLKVGGQSAYMSRGFAKGPSAMCTCS